MQLLFGEREGRERAPIGGLPDGVIAVTVPVRRDGQGHVPRNRRGQLNIEAVDLIAEGATNAYEPPATLDSRELIFALEAGRRSLATIVDYFGPSRAQEAAIALVRSGGVILRCAVDDLLDLAQPLSWRRSHSWSLMHIDILYDLRGRPDPDALRRELVKLMAVVPQLDAERALLEGIAPRSPLRVPPGSATSAGAWSVYEHALRAAMVWFPHQASGADKMTANDPAGRPFLDSKAWTPEREAAFANLVGLSFDQAVDKADTDLRLRGALKWSLGSVAADASVAVPWISLPARGLRAAGDVECRAVGVLLVENADTFEKVCKVMSPSQREILDSMFSALLTAQLQVEQSYLRWTTSLRRIVTRAAHGRHARLISVAALALEAAAEWVDSNPAGRVVDADVLRIGVLAAKDISQTQLWRDVGPQTVTIGMTAGQEELPAGERAALRLAAGTSRREVAWTIDRLLRASPPSPGRTSTGPPRRSSAGWGPWSACWTWP